jgi:molybdopterin-containing oxidoreductase family membrane subunit
MAINRSAEAMTIFLSYSSGFIPNYSHGSMVAWVLPIPNQFGSLWVNFIHLYFGMYFAITYVSIMLVFWWTGLLPDFAMLRDRAITPFNKEFILF